MTSTVPAHLVHLLEEPFYGFLGTIRPDDTVQVNPMWFQYDGDSIRFSHTTSRAKYRNLQRNPSMSLAVTAPDAAFPYLEVRGKLVEVIPDPEGAFYVTLGKRYGNAEQEAPEDSAERVILVMSIEQTSK